MKQPKELIDSTDRPIFKPTPHMIVWLDKAIELMTDNITEIATACGVDRTNWYKWLDLPEFNNWFKETWERKLKGQSFKLDVIGMKAAKRDTKALELMMRRVGTLTDSPNTLQQINVGKEGNSITFVNFTNAAES